MPYSGLETHEFVIPVLEELERIREVVHGIYSVESLEPTVGLLDGKGFKNAFASNVHKCLDKHSAIPNPSLFKICAAVSLAFVKCPVVGPDFVSGRIHKIPKHQNAYAVIIYCRRKLLGASVCSPGGQYRKLHNPIRFSGHFLYDLVELLGQQTPSTDVFRSVSLLYEALAYQANPKAQNRCVLR